MNTIRRELTDVSAREDGRMTHREMRDAPRISGTMARDRGLDLDANPFWGQHEQTERRAWAEAWMSRHIEIVNDEKRTSENEGGAK